MYILQDVLISKELTESLFFCCNLKKCKGACCVVGDAGAPLELYEIEQIQDNLEYIKPYMQEKAAKIITENTVFDYDQEGNMVTTLLNDRECIFANFENNIAYCAIEKAYDLDVIEFRKPASCFLYPIRVSKSGAFRKIEFHKWDICKPALVLGKSIEKELIDFVSIPLKEYFGEEWYQLFKESITKKP